MRMFGAGYEQNLELRILASPVVHIRASSPPVYTLQGLQDTTVHPDSARQLDAALKSASVSHRLELVSGAGHNPISVETMTPVLEWLSSQLKVVEEEKK